MFESLKRWFKSAPTKLDRGRRVLQAVTLLKTFVVSAFVPTLDRGAIPKGASAEAWDVLASVVGTYAMASFLKGKRPKEYEAYGPLVIASAGANDPQNEAMLQDCIKFVGRTLDQGGVSDEQALGLWLLWNLLMRAPTYDEAKASRAIGALVYRFAMDAWENSRWTVLVNVIRSVCINSSYAPKPSQCCNPSE